MDQRRRKKPKQPVREQRVVFEDCECECKGEEFYEKIKKEQEKYAFYADKSVPRLNYTDMVWFDPIYIGSLQQPVYQQKGAMAFGQYAGYWEQQKYAIAMGECAGYSFQNAYAIAIGSCAGKTVQGGDAISIGRKAGSHNQGGNAIAIGQCSGRTNQDVFAVSIGTNAAELDQGTEAISIGRESGYEHQGIRSIAIGSLAGANNQDQNSISIGTQAGNTSQSDNSVAIGTSAGQYNQSYSSVAIGYEAGKTSQSSRSVAIGYYSGQVNQSNDSVAIGNQSGEELQGSHCVAIGYQAGEENQGTHSVAIGNESGENNQGQYSVALGNRAGQNNQGQYSISIGSNAGVSNQHNNTIIIDAANTSLSSVTQSSCYINPLRQIMTQYDNYYDPTTKELSYHLKPIVVGDIKYSILTTDHHGWLLCNGRTMTSVDYPDLATIIGTSFGTPESPSTEFILPNAQGRVLGAVGNSGTTYGTNWTIGQTTGDQKHQLTVSEMPSHAHGITDPGHTHTYLGVNSQNAASGGDNVAENSPRPTETTSSSLTGITVQSTGGNVAHNIMQPTLFIGNVFIYAGLPLYP